MSDKIAGCERYREALLEIAHGQLRPAFDEWDRWDRGYNAAVVRCASIARRALLSSIVAIPIPPFSAMAPYVVPAYRLLVGLLDAGLGLPDPVSVELHVPEDDKPSACAKWAAGGGTYVYLTIRVTRDDNADCESEWRTCFPDLGPAKGTEITEDEARKLLAREPEG